MCSGRVDLGLILRAFYNRADGVFIGGCRLGECKYDTHGNYHALNTVSLAKRLLEHMGLNPERLRIAFMSSSDGAFFAQVSNEFINRVRELGPLGEGEGIGREELNLALGQLMKLVPYIKLVKKEKLGLRLGRPEEYERLYTREEIEELLGQVASYSIDPEKCHGCMRCARLCPAEAITGGKNEVHVIDPEKCLRCGTCLEACPPRFGAVVRKSEPYPLFARAGA